MIEEARDDEPGSLGFERVLVTRVLVKLKLTEKSNPMMNLIPWISWTKIVKVYKREIEEEKKFNKEDDIFDMPLSIRAE